MSEKIGFIGLGLLGQPMASNLIDEGYSLKIYNRTAGKAEPLVAKGAEQAATPAEALQTGGINISILWDDAVLEEIVTSDGFFEKLGQGGIHVSMATVLPETARRIARLHSDHGCIFVEATIFGIPTAAVARQLNIQVAGPKETKARVWPVLQAMGGKNVFDFGEEYGAANVVKIIGNYMIFAASQSMREGLEFATRNSVDPKAVVDMLTTTLFASPIYQSYGQRLVAGTYSSNLSPIPMKDIGLFKTTASQFDMPTPIADVLQIILRKDAGLA